jgi:hypothetical protein
MSRVRHLRGADDEAIEVHGRADYRDPEEAQGWGETGGPDGTGSAAGTTLYKWKAKFGGVEASDAKRLRVLEDENCRLK